MKYAPTEIRNAMKKIQLYHFADKIGEENTERLIQDYLNKRQLNSVEEAWRNLYVDKGWKNITGVHEIYEKDFAFMWKQIREVLDYSESSKLEDLYYELFLSTEFNGLTLRSSNDLKIINISLGAMALGLIMPYLVAIEKFAQEKKTAQLNRTFYCLNEIFISICRGMGGLKKFPGIIEDVREEEILRCQTIGWTVATEQLMFILCHEMAHFILEHFKGAKCRRFASGHNELKIYNYDHLQEYNADKLGFEILKRARPHAESAVSVLFEVMDHLEQASAFLTTIDANVQYSKATNHPPARKRKQNLQKQNLLPSDQRTAAILSLTDIENYRKAMVRKALNIL